MIETVEVTGRTRKPTRKKLNLVWWLQNDDEQRVDDGTADWYHPEWPHWRRYFYWNFLRNPLMNFRNYVIGVGDRNYKVTGRKPAMTIQRDDLRPAQYGWHWAALRLRWIVLPFVSYSGKRLVIQFGWQPSGYATIKINWRRKAWGLVGGYSHI
jgi:hypothetical protein